MAWTFGPLLLDGANHTVDSAIKETEFESGPARIKRVSTDQVNRITGSVYLPDAAAVQAWWAHWEGDANFGADWFTMPLKTEGVSATHTVRAKSPRVAPFERGYRLSLAIETRQRVIS